VVGRSFARILPRVFDVLYILHFVVVNVPSGIIRRRLRARPVGTRLLRSGSTLAVVLVIARTLWDRVPGLAVGGLIVAVAHCR
jgi:hypothetical protein